MENEWRVFGPPGTGKTYWIGKQVEAALAKYRDDQILITSYTRGAAVEAAGRIALPDPNIGTIHSICYNAIGRGEIAENHISEWNDPEYPMAGGKIDADDPGSDRRGEIMYGDALLAATSKARCQLIPKSQWQSDYVNFHNKWTVFKKERGYLDFTDMIETAYRDYDSCPIHARVLFVDEAQDLNPLQAAVIRKWGRGMDRFILVGDDDQAIYEWAGADAGILINDDISPSNIIELKHSKRVPRRVHEFAESWINGLSKRRAKTYHPNDNEGAVNYVAETWKAGDELLSTVLRDINNDKSVMVLASSAYLLWPFIRAMKESGILFHNPYRKDRSEWNPIVKKNGVVNSFDRMLYFARAQYGQTHKEIWYWAEHLRSEAIRPKGKALLKRLRSESSELKLSASQMNEFFPIETMNAIMKSDVEWFAQNCVESKKSMFEYPARVAGMGGIEGLYAEPKITVGTIHSVKGGEADCIYIIPDLSSKFAESWQMGERDALIRLFYVALTRAKESVNILGSASKWSVFQ